MAGGTITRIVGGTIISESETYLEDFDKIRHSAGTKIIYNSDTQHYVGDWEEIPATKYFVKGWWTDKDDDPIKEARILDTVKFHIQTQGIENPKGKKIEIKLFEHDTSVHLSLGTYGSGAIETRPFDDRVRIKSGENEITELALDESGRTAITINLTWGMHEMFNETFFGGFAEMGLLEFYFECSYGEERSIWLPASFGDYLKVTISNKSLFIKPATNDVKYGLPEIYAHNGSIITYAIEKMPNGAIKKFSMVKLRTTTTFRLQADIDKFKKEIYFERINLDTNRLESASYEVEEVSTFFKTNKNASQIYIDENIIEVPIEARGLLAIKNYGIKALKFAKVAADYYGKFEVLREMKEMIPQLSSNEKFNMPSLSTFVGFIPQLAVFAFGVDVIGWMVADSLRESKEIVDESILADWQNAKAKGLKEALKFLDSPWAKRNLFNRLFVGKSVLDRLLKGEFKSHKELVNYNTENFNEDKMYVIIFYEVKDETSKLDLTLVDSIFINQEQYL